MKRLLACALVLALTLSPALAFSDVAEDAWYAPYAQICRDSGLLQGTGADRFSPDAELTTAQAVTLAARLHWRLNGGQGALPTGGTPQTLYTAIFPGEPADPDILAQMEALSHTWYWDATYYLCRLDGIEAVELRHQPDDTADRRETAQLLALAARALEPLNQVDWLPDENSPAILALYRAGILRGLDEYGTFGPEVILTRAEAAAMTARILRPELRLRFTLTPAPLPEAFDGLPYSAHPVASAAAIVNVTTDPALLYGYDGTVLDWWGRTVLDNSAGTYDFVGTFLPDGLAKVRRDGLYGFLNLQGEEIVPCQYEQATDHHDGVVLAGSEAEGFTAFDTQGKPLGRLDGSVNYDNTAGGLMDEKTGLYGYLKPDGSVAVQAAYTAVYPSSEGLAAVRDGKGLLGFVDASGRLAVPCRYTRSTSGFSEGYAVVGANGDAASPLHYDGKFGMVDTRGNLAVPMEYNYLAPFSDGLAAFARWEEGGAQFTTGYLTPDGAERLFDKVMPGGYNAPASFSHGCAPFFEGELCGLMDTAFQTVLPARFLACTAGPDGQVLVITTVPIIF